MQKTIAPEVGEHPLPSAAAWLDLAQVAHVRLASEDPAHPIESALQSGSGPGWRAATPGRQTIWLHFHSPQNLEHIQLRFEVAEPRTQEFLLRWSNNQAATLHDLVRQQFNFSPGGATVEEEDYFPQLTGVTDLALTIVPDISGGPALASLRAWRLR